TLQFPQPGSYLVRRNTDAGSVVAELSTESANRSLALEPGSYHVTARAADHLLEGIFSVRVHQPTRVTPDRMRRVDYGRLVRKGGASRDLAFSTFAQGG